MAQDVRDAAVEAIATFDDDAKTFAAKRICEEGLCYESGACRAPAMASAMASGWNPCTAAVGT